ncbi:Nipped-B-like protein B [Pleurostoma richardsiae]|uniref:Nipped-B-like protein B n=1 Tax=Pleurostoma richardsiae TaxID=41990 RepID=A0AA38S573_9PEZI|nr:Nipped-B-like protein B [Pleurostoma richardsiae]
MTAGSASASSIAAVDASARDLYRRARSLHPELTSVATVVRSLHTVLKHLRAEVEDPDSLLNSRQHETSVYARQLTPIIHDCDFTLGRLGTLLDRCGGGGGGGGGDRNLRCDASEGLAVQPRPSATGADAEDHEITLIRTELENHTTNIDAFLNTVQLHNPTRSHASLDLDHADARQLHAIKDKVDVIAARLSNRRGSAGSSDADEDMWQQFRAELVSEGFSGDVLQKNKEILRAYIRELDAHGLLDSGSPPSVRGHTSYIVPPSAANPAIEPLRRGHDVSPKEMVPNMDNEKFMPSLKYERRQPELGPRCSAAHADHIPQASPPLPPPTQQQQQQLLQAPYHRRPIPSALEQSQVNGSLCRRYSSDSDLESSFSQPLALMSTRDLIAFDDHEAEQIVARMGHLHLSPSLQPPLIQSTYSVSPGASPNNGRYLPAPSHYPSPLPPAPDQTLSTSPQTQALLGVSPRYVPPLPPYTSPIYHPATMTPPPAYGSSPTVASAPVNLPAIHQSRSRLAPDSHGMDIPLNATWTRIRRALVSPEVLEKAGVRYEARPDFVAILGILNREQIAEYARLSAETKGSEELGSDSDALWDESDTSDDDLKRYSQVRYGAAKEYHPAQDEKGGDRGTEEKGTKVYPVIVPPPTDNKTSPASTVAPKPILKNQNTHRVRFDADGPREISSTDDVSRERSPSSRDERNGERDRHGRNRQHEDKYARRRERDRDHERGDRENQRDRVRDRESDGRRDHHGHYKHRGSDRERDRDRDRDWDRDRDRDRDRERSSTSDDRRDDRRRIRKSVWGETIGAVGIGGAAASLLSVLTEAAAGL